MPVLDSLTRVAEISLSVAQRAGSLAVSTVRQVAKMALDHGSSSREDSSWTSPAPASDRPGSGSTQPRQGPPPAPPAPAAQPQTSPAPDPLQAPDHVDREAVLVAESADAGAAGGAGAQIRIAEPWKGYGRLTAKEVNDRLATATPESLAVARLYESAHRNRVTVLKEIDRRLAVAAS